MKYQDFKRSDMNTLTWLFITAYCCLPHRYYTYTRFSLSFFLCTRQSFSITIFIFFCICVCVSVRVGFLHRPIFFSFSPSFLSLFFSTTTNQFVIHFLFFCASAVSLFCFSIQFFPLIVFNGIYSLLHETHVFQFDSPSYGNVFTIEFHEASKKYRNLFAFCFLSLSCFRVCLQKFHICARYSLSKSAHISQMLTNKFHLSRSKIDQIEYILYRAERKIKSTGRKSQMSEGRREEERMVASIFGGKMNK